MAGLLDFVATPEGQGLLSAAFGGLAGARRGQPLNSIGRAGLAGLAGYSQAQDRITQQEENAVQKQYREMQMQGLQAQLDQQKAQKEWRTGLPQVLQQAQPTYGAGDEGPTMTPGNPQALQSYLTRPDSPFFDKILERQLFPKEEESFTLGEGQVRYGPGGKIVAQGPTKVEPMPTNVREYEYARSQGYNGTYEQFQLAMKKAGASRTSVEVNTAKPFLNEIAGGLGKSIIDAQGGAQAATGTIETVNRLYQALDSGKVMAGPGTTFRQYGIQLGSILGVSGKDAQETLLNTRQAVQSLAQLELDAAQQMKGQGQITEAERSIIRRAASGDIDSMTTGELRLLAGVLDRTARTKINSYNARVQPLMSNPQAAPLAPFLNVQEPQKYTPSLVRKPQGGAAAPRFLGFEGEN